MAQKTGTPARSTRSRTKTPAPVPAIPVGSSNSYGTSGKANLQTQVTVDRRDLSSALRGVANAAEDNSKSNNSSNASSSTAFRTPSRRGRGRASGKLPEIILEGSEPDEQGQFPTYLDHGAVYAGAPTSVPSIAIPSAGFPELSHATADYEPSGWVVALVTVPKWCYHSILDFGKDFWATAKAMLALALLMAIMALLSLITWFLLSWLFFFFADHIRFPSWNFRSPIKTNVTVTSDEIEDFYRFYTMYKLNETLYRSLSVDSMNQRGINYAFLVQIEELQAQYKDLNQRVLLLEETASLHNHTLISLKELLPVGMIVRTTADEKLELSEEFWAALNDRLYNQTSRWWEEFLKSNEARVRAFSKESIVSEVESATHELNLVSRDAVLEMINENYKQVQRDFGPQLQQVERTLLKKLRESFPNDSKEKHANNFATLQGLTTTSLMLLKNQERVLKERNWLNPNLGARINARQTSPTYDFLKRGWWTPRPLPPIEALTKWDELGDCWCAAPSSDKGKGQIEVILPAPIYHNHLIVEHPPSQTGTNIQSAPRELEIWAEVNTTDFAKKITPILREDFGSYSLPYCESKPPSDRHVCIGTAEYDIHSDNWVQVFRLVNPWANEFPIHKLSVRAASNWGANFTCFYRLRMTGELQNI
ncbi:hypothetical protein M433DRAFT_143687 [Acidomyces richmondensis BFW]|nr:MAG: hypothetical protein FE78DRAFT_385919 [Acidomyces sp. 'richmondensis']KYG45724.1 hypothetical protein M433DRAFT_143687 [Acidomyces richmondensis BFW]